MNIYKVFKLLMNNKTIFPINFQIKKQNIAQRVQCQKKPNPEKSNS